MSWTFSMIIVSPAPMDDAPEILDALGYRNLSPLPNQVFDHVLKPENREVYGQVFNGNLFIVAHDIDMNKSVSMCKSNPIFFFFVAVTVHIHI